MEEWHVFDVEHGLEARQTNGGYEVRDAKGKVTAMTKEEFDQLRQEGPNPKGL